jgi:hypothetical protein
MSTTAVNEERIVGALRQLPKTKWRQVLRFIESLQPPKNGRKKRRWTPQELRRLPREQRNAILAEQAALMADEYRNNPELTGFEAFGEKDLYVDHPDTETL